MWNIPIACEKQEGDCPTFRELCFFWLIDARSREKIDSRKSSHWGQLSSLQSSPLVPNISLWWNRARSRDICFLSLKSCRQVHTYKFCHRYLASGEINPTTVIQYLCQTLEVSVDDKLSWDVLPWSNANIFVIKKNRISTKQKHRPCLLLPWSQQMHFVEFKRCVNTHNC